MKDIRVKDIVEICNAKLICGNQEVICESFSNDTRQIQQGDVYIGVKGENVDGNLFYETAFENGAKVCILDNLEITERIKNKYNDKVILLVENTTQAIQKIATYKRSLYDIPVIAITGSSGKTSTKDIVASVVSQKYNTLKTQGNFNSQLGLPLTILRLKEHNALVVEMGMNHLKEIETLTKIAKPTIAIITNVGTSHIGNLCSRENILKAKLEILEGLSKDGTLIINNDNDLLHNWYIQNKDYKVKTFGIDNTSDWNAINIQMNDQGSTFEAICKKDKFSVKVPVGGKHFIYNSLCAITVGELLGISKEEITQGIQHFELTKRRMDVRKNSQNITIINDTYNANYDSVKAAIEYLAEIKANRKIAVLGDMLELGEFSKQLHEKVGEEIVKNKIDILVTVGKEAENIAKKAEELGLNKQNIYKLETTTKAVELLKKIFKPEDVVLVKASNGMKFDKIIEGIE